MLNSNFELSSHKKKIFETFFLTNTKERITFYCRWVFCSPTSTLQAHPLKTLAMMFFIISSSCSNKKKEKDILVDYFFITFLRSYAL